MSPPNTMPLSRSGSKCSSQKPSLEYSRSSNSSPKEGSMVGIPTESNNHNNEAMASLAAPADPLTIQLSKEHREPFWPRRPRAYFCLFGCMLQMAISWGYVNAYGTYASFYMEGSDTTTAPLSTKDHMFINIIGGTQCCIILSGSLIIGRLLDAGLSRYVLAIGTVLVAIGSFTLSAVPMTTGSENTRYALIWFTQGFIMALGMACFFVSSSQIAGTWFGRSKGIALGCVACGASLGGALWSTMIRFLNKALGFSNEARVVAAVVTAFAMLAYFLSVPNPDQPKNESTTWRLSTFWDARAFDDACFCWLAASIACVFMGFYPIFFNLEAWAVEAKVGYRGDERPPELPETAMQTFLLLSILNASSSVGRIVPAYISDKLPANYGALHVHAFVTSVAAVLCLFLWPYANTVNTAISYVVVFGIFSGAVIGLPPASMAFILGKTNREAQKVLGQRIGMMYCIASPWSLVGPIVAGHLSTEFDTFRTVQYWSGACLLLAALCMCGGIYSYYRRPERAASKASIEMQGP